MKKRFVTAIALAMALVLTACSSTPAAPAPSGGSSAPQAGKEVEPVVLKLAHVVIESHPYQHGCEDLAKRVEEYTDGRIKIEISPNATLGSERDLCEGVQMGTVDMCVTTNAALTNFAPDFSVYDFPYLFLNPEEAYKVMDGDFGQGLLKDLENINIKGLGYYVNGFRNVMTAKDEIHTVEDLKGLKIRTMESAIMLDTFRAMGCNPTPMTFSEVYTAVQQGAIDGQENPAIATVSQNLHEVTQLLSKTEHFFTPAELLINMDLFNSFSAEDQEAIIRAGKESQAVAREQAEEQNNHSLMEFMQEKGVKVIEVDKTSFIEATKEVYDKYADQYGHLVDQVRAELGR